MHENTHQQSQKPNSLESNEKMKGLMPPAFGFADGESADSSNEGGNFELHVNYSSEIVSVEGTPQKGFGLTTPNIEVPSMAIKQEGDRFRVNADYVCWPKIEIWPGPYAFGKYLNIEDENSPYITQENYQTIAKVLMPKPDGWRSGGAYWSKPQVEKHEEFHANEIIEFGRLAIPKVIEKFSRMKVESEGDAEFEVYGAAEALKDELVFLMEQKPAEDRAYAAGYEGYVQLVQAILKKGNAGEYK
jgi:hypothetical protein